MKTSFVFLLLGVTLTFLGCSSPEKVQNESLAPIETLGTETNIKRIELGGVNRQAYYSPDGEKIVFISSDRIAHRGPQLYIHNLKNKSEQRLTYQDGVVAHPAFLNDSQIIFSSSTDELKDLDTLMSRRKLPPPAQIKLGADPFFPSEIYLYDLIKKSQNQITRQKGSDDFPFPLGSHEVLFSSEKNGKIEITKLNLKNLNQETLRTTKANNIEPIYIKETGAIYFIQLENSLGESQIMETTLEAKSILKLSLPQGLYTSLATGPSPEWIIVSAILKPESKDKIYAINVKAKILCRLLETPLRERWPHLSPDKKNLIVTLGEDKDSFLGTQTLHNQDLCKSATVLKSK